MYRHILPFNGRQLTIIYWSNQNHLTPAIILQTQVCGNLQINPSNSLRVLFFIINTQFSSTTTMYYYFDLQRYLTI